MHRRDFRFRAETAASGVAPPGSDKSSTVDGQSLDQGEPKPQDREYDPVLLELYRNTAPPEFGQDPRRYPSFKAPSFKKILPDGGKKVETHGDHSRKEEYVQS